MKKPIISLFDFTSFNRFRCTKLLEVFGAPRKNYKRYKNVAKGYMYLCEKFKMRTMLQSKDTIQQVELLNDPRSLEDTQIGLWEHSVTPISEI